MYPLGGNPFSGWDLFSVFFDLTPKVQPVRQPTPVPDLDPDPVNLLTLTHTTLSPHGHINTVYMYPDTPVGALRRLADMRRYAEQGLKIEGAEGLLED